MVYIYNIGLQSITFGHKRQEIGAIDVSSNFGRKWL